MKKLTIFLTTLFFSAGLSAQVILALDTVVEQIIPNYFETVGHDTLYNTSLSNYNFQWVRNEIILEPEWITQVCDCNACYSSVVSTEQFELLADTACRLDVHLKPNNNFIGFGLVELVVTDLDDANHVYNVIYIFDSELVGTSQLDVSDIKVFPNPSRGIFHVSNDEDRIKSIEVNSSAGVLMKQVDVGDRDILNIIDLPKGSYLLNLIGENTKPLGTKLISKL